MRNLSNLLLLVLFLTYNSYADNYVGIKEVDICIYGATPSGITAAISAKRENKSVVIIEPSK
ncbi:FAD-dependent oxidoreductase [Pleomorphovibrio marinus]|uniref:FAD-dependent oxidoreductase n=1 Tax=Pleomorphovibrio marinus TaxID=2164132 RepID=UPI000E0A0D57|nr:FAD-dependent oxidoreductase [Pleomorphovibrio marinus]